MYVRNPGQDRVRRELLTAGKRYCLVFGGSRSGKTLELTGTIAERALIAPNSRHLIVRQEGTSAKRAIVKGTWPEMLALRFPQVKTKWHEQYGYIELPNGSEVWVGGLNDEKSLEKILGNEYASIYMNEASECRYTAFTLLRTRLAQTATKINGKPLPQRFYVDLNPTVRQHWTYRLWRDGIDPEDETPVDLSSYGWGTINPFENARNLDDEFLKELDALPMRARKRFRDGEYVADAENALWRRDMIHRTQNVPDLVRIVVAVDPAVSDKAGSDETGIVVVGADAGGNGYVLADESGRYRPEQWARRALAAFNVWGADRVIAEVNQGGDLVESMIRSVQPNVPYTGVHATRGKEVRAEPVAGLYEQGRIFHGDTFPQLEDQMCSMVQGMDRKAMGYSPDRVDALVWGFMHLFPQMTREKKHRAPALAIPINKPYARAR